MSDQVRKTRAKKQASLVQQPILTATKELKESALESIVVSEELRKTITQKLQEYDGQTQHFVILEGLAETKPEYMKSHKTVIPIGEHCQAQLPVFLGSNIYAFKGLPYSQLLKSIKLNDRLQDQPDFAQKLRTFREEMGIDRTQQEFAFSCKYYLQSNLFTDYVQYLRANRQWLQDFFDSLYLKKGTKKPSKSLKKLPVAVKAASTKY